MTINIHNGFRLNIENGSCLLLCMLPKKKKATTTALALRNTIKII